MAMPPANVTGRLHMGHAMFATLQVFILAAIRLAGEISVRTDRTCAHVLWLSSAKCECHSIM